MPLMIYPPSTPVTQACVVEAARVTDVPLAALAGILRAEGGKVGMSHRNSNGTVDFGPMQINSVWLPVLAQAGVTSSMLLYNGCVNVLVGAWILRWEIALHDQSLWAGIEAYHSATPPLARQYQIHVYRALARTKNLKEVVNAANP